MPKKNPSEIVKVKRTPRVCLRCEKTFPSTGPGNRICKRCSTLSDNYTVAMKYLDHRSHP